jgi:ABC-2 type transport system permease protein
MRLYPLFVKAMIENFRDWKILALGITFAPFFVVLMHFYFGEATEIYRLVFVNHDRGAAAEAGKAVNAGRALILALEQYSDEDDAIAMDVSQKQGMAEAQESLKNKSVDLIVEIPANFSKTLVDYKKGERSATAVMKTYGDPTNPKYVMAASWCDALAFQFAADLTGLKGPLTFVTESLTPSKALTDFDLYVPGLLGLALMILMFTAAATLIKEKDKGTLMRLRLSNMTTTEWLIAVSLSQVIIGLLALGSTYLTAVALGYRTTGSMIAVISVSILSCLAIIAISVLVAAWLRTIFDLMTVGCFPFFILMFFSGGMFPIPTISLFALGGRSIDVNDILPTTHSIAAFGKILNQGSGLGDVAFEMGAITVLTIGYFSLGIWLFSRRHMCAK